MGGALLGGKGGFGSILKDAGKSGPSQQTRDFGMCRDLYGRRLVSVNNEIRLRVFFSRDEQEKRKRLGDAYEEPAPTGLAGWHLGLPSWAEGISSKPGKGSFKQARRKTAVCRDWQYARSEGRKAPEGAPRWWGCPRGQRCEFAHGEEELRSEAKLLAAERTREAARDAAAASLDKYTSGLYVYGRGGDDEYEDRERQSNGGGNGGGAGRSMMASVLQGLRAQAGWKAAHGGAASAAAASSAAGPLSVAAAVAGAASSVGGKRSRAAAGLTGAGAGGSSVSAADMVGRVGFQPVGWALPLLDSSIVAAAAAGSAALELTPPAAVIEYLPHATSCLVAASSAGSSAAGDDASAAVAPPAATAARPEAAADAAAGTAGAIDAAGAIAEIEGRADFGTVLAAGIVCLPPALPAASSAADAAAGAGGRVCVSYYYEVEVVTGGVAQVGWCTGAFLRAARVPAPAAAAGSASSTSAAGVITLPGGLRMGGSGTTGAQHASAGAVASAAAGAGHGAAGDEEGNGIGDDASSWAYDGCRGLKWHGAAEPYPAAAAMTASGAGAASGDGAAARTLAAAQSADSELSAAADAASAPGANSTADPSVREYVPERVWREGDVVGCLLTLTVPPAASPEASMQGDGASGDAAGAAAAVGSAAPADSDAASPQLQRTVQAEIRYTLNGVNLGTAFSEALQVPVGALTQLSSQLSSTLPDAGAASTASATVAREAPVPADALFVPALSLEAGEIVRLNLGQAGFAYARPAHGGSGEVEVALATATGAAAAAAAAVGGDAAGAAASAAGVEAIDSFLSALPCYSARLPAGTTPAPSADASASDAAAAAASDSLLAAAKRPRRQAGDESSHVGQPSATAPGAVAPRNAETIAAEPPAAHATGAAGAACAALAAPDAPAEPRAIDLSAVASERALADAGYTLEDLKLSLAARGLKAGGTWAERAQRLLAVRGLSPEQIPAKLRGPGFPGPALR
jgi:hypothetical protein